MSKPLRDAGGCACHVDDAVRTVTAACGLHSSWHRETSLSGPSVAPAPLPMILTCPGPRANGRGVCGARHIDEGEFATKPHHTHSCQVCGHTWRPAVAPTVGVQFLPGFKNGGAT